MELSMTAFVLISGAALFLIICSLAYELISRSAKESHTSGTPHSDDYATVLHSGMQGLQRL
jgi:hypothetical protein